MNFPPLILASASPRRSQLLKQLELDFEVVPTATLELHQEHLSPVEIAQLNAHRKARSVAKKNPDVIVIGADTIVALKNRIFGKPRTREEAVEMLLALQGKVHTVVTGVSLIHLRTYQERLFAETTRVHFKRLTREQVEAYLSRINPLDKAGGYAIQEHGEMIIQKIAGSRTNVIGLPLERLKSELERLAQPVLH
jgi:septum formation protein